MRMEGDLRMRRAGVEELDEVCEFFWRVCDECQDEPTWPAWKREIYPSREDLKRLLGEGSLWLGELAGDPACETIASIAVNHDVPDGYDKVAWPSGLPAVVSVVIHLVCVAPGWQRRGIARQLLTFAHERAREMGAKVIRLDAMANNVPAQRLYERAGYARVGEASIFYEDTGWADFVMYEYAL